MQIDLHGHKSQDNAAACMLHVCMQSSRHQHCRNLSHGLHALQRAQPTPFDSQPASSAAQPEQIAHAAASHAAMPAAAPGELPGNAIQPVQQKKSRRRRRASKPAASIAPEPDAAAAATAAEPGTPAPVSASCTVQLAAAAAGFSTPPAGLSQGAAEPVTLSLHASSL